MTAQPKAAFIQKATGNGNSTETRVAQKRVARLQSPVYKSVHTVAISVCSMSSSEEEAVALYILRKRQNRRRLSRRFSIHPYNAVNYNHSQWQALQDLANYPEKFCNYFRMSKDSFDFLLNLVTPMLEKKSTNWREPISVGERLTITLR